MPPMRSTLITVSLLLFAAIPVQAVEPADVLLVLAIGTDAGAELAGDVTEALTFTIARDKGMRFLPKEKVKGEMDYESPTKPGNCVFDNACLRKVKQKLGARWFIVARLALREGGYQITVTRIGDSADEDVSTAKPSPAGAASVINTARGLVVGSLKQPMTTLVLSVNIPDALVEINGVKRGEGPTSVPVKPGRYKIRVSKAGYTPFEATVICNADQQCVVPANIFKAPVNSLNPDPRVSTVDSTPKILQITGWTGAGIGLVMSGVGIAFGIQAKSLQNRADTACSANPCGGSLQNRADAEQLEREGRMASKLFNGVGIPGFILLAAGTALAVVGHVLEPETGAEVEIQPSFGPGGAYVNTVIRF